MADDADRQERTEGQDDAPISEENEPFGLYDRGITPDAAEDKLKGLFSASEDDDAGDSGEPDGDVSDDDDDLDADDLDVEPDKGDEPGEGDEDEDFGEEFEDDDEDLERDEEARVHSVPVDGKPHEVTLRELKDSFSFRTHNTQISQKLAARSKEMDVEAAKLRDEREEYGTRLVALEQTLAAAAPQEPDWDTLETEDPAKYAIEAAKWDRARRKTEVVTAERQRVYDEQVEAARNQLTVFRGEQAELLLEAIPSWKDPAVAKKEQRALADYAIATYGFTAQELDDVLDHRALVMMRKAMRYDRMIFKGKRAADGKRKRPAGTKPLKPGTRASQSKKLRRGGRARQRLAKTGRVRDASSAVLDILEAEKAARKRKR